MKRILQSVVAGGIAVLCLAAAPAARADEWRGDRRDDGRVERREDGWRRQEYRRRLAREEQERRDDWWRRQEYRRRLAREERERRERERCEREARRDDREHRVRRANLQLQVDIGRLLAPR
jgi:hypothetical protein